VRWVEENARLEARLVEEGSYRKTTTSRGNQETGGRAREEAGKRV